MSAALLTSQPTQLTFPWMEEATPIPATTSRAGRKRLSPTQMCATPAVSALVSAPAPTAMAPVSNAAATVSLASRGGICQVGLGQRTGREVLMGSLMFNLLKRYGITQEQIAAELAAMQ